MSLGLIDQLTHSTVRIETVLHSGGISTGTGFYMDFLQKEDTCIAFLVKMRCTRFPEYQGFQALLHTSSI